MDTLTRRLMWLNQIKKIETAAWNSIGYAKIPIAPAFWRKYADELGKNLNGRMN